MRPTRKLAPAPWKNLPKRQRKRPRKDWDPPTRDLIGKPPPTARRDITFAEQTSRERRSTRNRTIDRSLETHCPLPYLARSDKLGTWTLPWRSLNKPNLRSLPRVPDIPRWALLNTWVKLLTPIPKSPLFATSLTRFKTKWTTPLLTLPGVPLYKCAQRPRV